MPLAARKEKDVGACAIHGVVSLATGSPDVDINGYPAHRLTDSWACGAATSTGSHDVDINGLLMARIGDLGSHGGVIITGSPDVEANS